MKDGIQNALIESVSLDDGDRGMLTGWLYLDYGGSGQGFGGHCLYLPKSYRHHEVKSFAGDFIFRCMQIGGVSSWQKLQGKSIRVDVRDGLIAGIGHIVKDDWFYPKNDFENREDVNHG